MRTKSSFLESYLLLWYREWRLNKTMTKSLIWYLNHKHYAYKGCDLSLVRIHVKHTGFITHFNTSDMVFMVMGYSTFKSNSIYYISLSYFCFNVKRYRLNRIIGATISQLTGSISERKRERQSILFFSWILTLWR